MAEGLALRSPATGILCSGAKSSDISISRDEINHKLITSFVIEGGFFIAVISWEINLTEIKAVTVSKFLLVR